MNKINRIKKRSLIKLIEESILSTPIPTRISYLWNIGFLLGITLILQIITGLVLSINYTPSTSEAFQSVIHIIRDLDSGWIIRYTHINGASLFFILMYAHIARGVYFGSPSKKPIVWISGLVLLLSTIATAFIGYVLPWGQMSYWGATVITRIISALPYLGDKTLIWVWGGFSVSQPTLNRFFSLHFILPIVVAATVIAHIALLHQKGSSNPTGTNPNLDKIKFSPYFSVKDILPLTVIIIILAVMVRNWPNFLGDVENFNQVRTTSTPTHIQPEWYFLFAYAILRAVPSKLGGVLIIGAAVLVSVVLTIKKNKTNTKFSPFKKITFFTWISSVVLLTWLGANPVEQPFTILSKVVSLLYFSTRVIL